MRITCVSDDRSPTASDLAGGTGVTFRQIYNEEGYPLRPRVASPIPFGPRRATPGWVKWSCDRWTEHRS
jgi:hypothetical protein